MMETINSPATTDKVVIAVDTAAAKVKPAIHRAADAAQGMLDKAVSAMEPTTEWVSEHAKSLKVAQQKMMEGTTKYVAANPFKSLGAAVLLGLLIKRLAR